MKTTCLTIIITIFVSVLMSFQNLQSGYQPGDKAVDFSLKNVDGKMVSLKDYRDAKGYIIVFTCNHCPFAKLYEDRIIDLHKKYASKGLPVIAINPNDPVKQPEDSFENMAKRAKEKGYGFPYVFDETQAIAKAYGAERTPHVFVLRKEGSEYIVEFIGAIDDNAQDASGAKEKFVEKAADEILAGKQVTTKSAKAIGCTIKWKS